MLQAIVLMDGRILDVANGKITDPTVNQEIQEIKEESLQEFPKLTGH
jgi:hypothetical protein